MNKKYALVFLAVWIWILGGCQPHWSFEIQTERQTDIFSESDYAALIERFPDNEFCEGLLLEQVFYEKGIEVIDFIEVDTVSSQPRTFGWMESVEKLCLNGKGEITMADEAYKPVEIRVEEMNTKPDVMRITDIPGIALSALGISHDMPHTDLIANEFRHVALIFLDGFGFGKFQEAKSKGLISALTGSGDIYQALTVYPPRTVTGSAAVLTGLTPEQNGVDRGGIRKTESVTLFDLVSEKGLSSRAIEGDSLAFNLRNTEVTFSGDRDLNGGTDDNVFSNTLDVISNDMPRLLWVHFHGIDDYGHTYGSDDLILDEKISEINSYLEQIWEALPKDTLIIYFADHGMHSVDEEGRLGNHGHLLFEDMVIPIVIQTK